MSQRPRKLTVRLADRIGSHGFLVANIVWFAGWIIANLVMAEPFDPYPFGLLTMIVSLEAILLSILVLFAQNRAERIDAHRNATDLRVDLTSLRLIAKLLEKHGIDPSDDAELQHLLAITRKRRTASSSP